MKRSRYVSVKTKFFIALTTALAWVALSIFLSRSWLQSLSSVTNFFISFLIIAGIAYIPGFMNTFLLTSVLIDKQPEFKNDDPDDDITILVAAYNEGDTIYDTLSYINAQDYKGKIKTIVINNNSNDHTVQEVLRANRELPLDIECLDENTPGKFNALNTGLKKATTEFIITLDADTILHKSAVRYLVARIKSAPNDIAAVAGSVLVRNSRDNLLAKLQEWDYFLCIMSIKRMQGLFQGTLVAQGAFSIYKTNIVKEIGGWSDAIGEDIILTWNMLVKNLKVYYEPLAIAFTDVPTEFSHFVKQRSRWARGMIEGLRLIKPWEQPNMYYKFLTGIDICILFMDIAYVLFFIPGVILALFGKFHILGPFWLLVVPLTVLTFGLLFFKQRTFFKALDLKVRKNSLGFIVFILCYQFIMSPISLYGYIQEFFNMKRVWK